ncbi:nuclear transport factor 2 family protein [Nocardiopsis halophila]|uniref:nuclear transport factor 2 family protein n=1 Tax=Nocardiopsis halophila TaxID=141692 RepID=UPI001F4D1E26|nr:nuclear transport factor 2 family protein [Nocardiopsis halophila]
MSETGIATRSQFLGHIASGDLTHSMMEPVTEPQVLLLDGTAVSTARIVNTAHYRGNRIDADEWTTDVFVRRGGRWLCVNTHITPAAQS